MDTCYFGFFRLDSADQPHQTIADTVEATPSSYALDIISSPFEEPFIPTVQGADRKPILSALAAFRADPRPKHERVEVFEEYLASHSRDPWSTSVRANLGIYYHRTSRFTRSLKHLKQAWVELEDFEETNPKALADRVLGEYAITLAHLGRFEELEPLFEEIEGRSLRGSATELVGAAKEGLGAMKNRPEFAFLCGPKALNRIASKSSLLDDTSVEAFKTLPSTRRGTSLAQVQALSQKLGLNYQMAYREPGSNFITPAVIHWKEGHFAALFEENEEGLYSVEDETAGVGRVKSKACALALEEEASGYFLVPPGPLPEGWRTVSRSEGGGIWGRGDTGLNFESNGTTDDDEIIEDGSGTGGGDSDCPMTTWSVHALLVSLRLVDTPVGLSPAAFSVPFRVTYSQREINQPAIFDFSNLGPKWTSNWISFVTDNRSESDRASVYQANGGLEYYIFESSSTVSRRGDFTQAILSDVGDGFVLEWPDGSVDEYRYPVGSRYHLSARTDPQGNTATLGYDSAGRLLTITDAVGRVMTLSYELGSDPLKITRVTDPFGRSAAFTYTADGHLESITDVIGIVSSFQYDTNDFIHELNTPYGTTNFAYADISSGYDKVARILEVTDALGRKHRFEASEGFTNPNAELQGGEEYGLAPTPGQLPFAEDETPAGMDVNNTFMWARNTFHWAPQQIDAIPDFSKATVYHFEHAQEFTDIGFLNVMTSRLLESKKRPLEARVWYKYETYPAADDPLGFKLRDTVSQIGKVLSDGSTQLRQFSYNDRGNVEQVIDPTGRVYHYAYHANEIDLASISTGGQILLQATYDANHNITSLTDASGSTSTFSYDSRGLLLSATNPLGETTQYSYSATGNLSSIERPLGKIKTLGYDSAERVASIADSEGHIITLSYDAADRPTRISYPDGTSSTFSYTNLDLVESSDRLDRTTRFTYDELRRPSRVTDANGGVTQLGYVLENKVRSLTDPNGNTIQFQYDLQERLVEKSYPDGASRTMSYEACTGRLHSVTDALGQSRTYSYFLDNQLKSIDYSDPTTPDVGFTNDPFLPRPLSMTDGQGTTTLTYVPVGSPGANKSASVSGPFGDTASFSYDVAGRPIGSLINGSASSVTYDELWRPTSISNALDTFQMDYLGTTGQVTSLTSAFGPSMQYTYADNVGDRRLIQIKNLRNDLTPLTQLDYSHDAMGQITQLTESLDGAGGGDDGGNGGGECTCKKPGKRTGHKKGKGKGHQEHGRGHGYGHEPDCEKHGGPRNSSMPDWVKEILSTVWGWDLSDWDNDEDCDPDGGGDPPSGNATTWQFAYDNISQLVGVNLNQNPYATYTIDPAGNLTSVTVEGATTTFGHNSLNQTVSPGSYNYDPKGQTNADSEGRTLEWDSAGRVTAIVQGNRRSEFRYDGMSRRTVITEYVDYSMVSKKLYWWLGGTMVCERDGLQTGFPITKRYLGQGLVHNGTRLYYTTDHLGSVRKLLDESGNILAEYRYSIYGERTKVSGSLDSDFGYAGLFHHEPSGLDLATYRLYDAKQRRFISRDPLGEGVDYNLYRYANNNPVNYVDPEGLLQRYPDGTLVMDPVGERRSLHQSTGEEWSVFEVTLYTDSGDPISATINTSGDKRFDCDCHGYTFTNCDTWINDDQIDTLLEGDGYYKLPEGELPYAGPGSIAIFRDSNGKVIHSGKVNSIDSNGNVWLEDLSGTQESAGFSRADQGPGTVEYYYRDPLMD